MSRFRFGAAEWVLVLLMALFALTFGWLSLQRHAAFETNGFDLGNVNQALWNTAHGRFLQFTNMAPVDSRLALHVEPILLLLVPFYWLVPDGPRFLLAGQAVVVGLGAWPLFLIARRRLGPTAGLMMGLAYLLLPTLESAVLYDFHAVTLAPTFLLFAVNFVDVRRWSGYILFSLLAAACKEEMGLTVAMLGLFIALWRRHWRIGGLTLLAGLAWFWLAVFVVQPRFSPVGSNVQLDRYLWLGDSPGAVLATFVRQPGLVWDHVWNQANLAGYLGGLLWPTAWLSLLAPLAWLPALPSLAVNLLSDNPFTWRLESFHYGAPLAPFVLLATVFGAERLANWLERLAAKRALTVSRTALLLSVAWILLFASLTYHYFRGYSPLARPFRWYTVSRHHQLGAQLAALFDPETAIFAPLTLNPHVSSRRYLYQSFEQLALEPAADSQFSPPDLLWIDVTGLPNENNLHQFLRDEILPRSKLVSGNDGYLLLRPDTSEAGPPPDFYSFTVARKAPDYPLQVEFEDPACGQPLAPLPGQAPCPVVQLLGFDLDFNRDEEVQVTTYWLALPPLERDIFPTLYLLDDEGQPVGATSNRPATLVWRPSRRWFTDEVVVVRFDPTGSWVTGDRAGYGLALGVTTGDDPWDGSGRLRPGRVETEFATPLPAEGTLLELSRFNHVAGMSEGGPSPRRRLQPLSRKRLEVTFAGQIRLLGFDPPRPVLTETGPAVRLTLSWQALVDTPGDYIRFVHLVGPDGALWGQHDAVPVAGAYPTRLWAEGEFVGETVVVPVEPARPPGDYVLHVGLYEPSSGRRLLTASGQDHAEIALGLTLD
jgi:uncharacterized membrane protein